jgi:hypothetical protein
MNTFRKLRSRNPFRRYDFRQLVDTRMLAAYSEADEHLICDIDKTYLETNTEGAIQMLKIAFEDVKDKVTVPGASPFLIAARWSNPFRLCDEPQTFTPRSLHFVSASPPQLRRILEDKLIHDGLDWNSDSFKNQVYNIRKGRLNLLRHHVAYKTATILSIMQQAKPGSRFYLIGDNAEYDAYIYLGLSLYLTGKLQANAYERYLCAGGVQSQVAADLRSLMNRKPEVSIAGILIRKAPGYQFVAQAPLTDQVVLFRNYYECVLVFIRWGLIEASALLPITKEFHNYHGFSRETLLATLSASMTEDFAADDPQTPYLQQTIDQLKSIGSVGPISTKSSIMKPRMNQAISLSEKELIDHSNRWAQKLTSSQNPPPKTPPPETT